ncbi:methyltransferase, FxLD system [Streptomyces sp. ST2-7A]|uniref:methyltransferase, FxLD system n=1 Tax=Streptomyces sp. ST2-7A TaxID=2907214 RepID=UPI001F000D74|nr:methyltransferase, FxLD system [Streptomyces sp. ST2-7A]MCE7080131.1 methyltransferase, FxLD system [Streptomyces sp. ST2-7A]
MNEAPSNEPSGIEALREKLIAALHDLDAIRTPQVEAAIRAVPRHLFLPEVSLARAYEPEDAVITKRDGQGMPISSVSAARIQAFMLEQADIRPGMKVWEIGSGGLNAAYIQHLVGDEGQVVTSDIDPEVAHRARHLLTRAGYDRVTVVESDAEFGLAEYAPFDRIIVTVGAWDIPPTWTGQLADDGRIVLPLRVRGLTRSVALEREGPCLVSTGYELCGFVPMQGAGEKRLRRALLHDVPGEEVALVLDDGHEVDIEALCAALAQPATRAWSGVHLRAMESVDPLDLWLACALPGFAVLNAKKAARERGIIHQPSGLLQVALIEGRSFAYRTIRPVTPERRLWEFGAVGHGPEGKSLADRLVEEIRTWDRDHRSPEHMARFEVHPAGTPDTELPPGLVVNKRHTRVTVSWPPPA